MKKIVVKSGVNQLHLFKNKGYTYFEAYLSGTEDLNQLLQTEMKLIAIHLPSVVDGSTLNFCDSGIAEEKSFAKLREVVQFCNDNDVKIIVIHLGFFNALLDDRYKILARVAAKFNQLTPGNVALCLENVPCWTTISFENEPIISTEEHFLYFKNLCPRIGAVFDVDHLAINTVFNYFYGDFKKQYPGSTDKAAFRKKMETEIAAGTARNIPFFTNLVEEKIKKFLSAVKPNLVHAVGSDFCNYRLVEKLPLVGEALPLGYQGKIKGFDVKDRLNHSLWLPLLPDNVFITLELYLRDEYSYLEQIEKDYGYLTELI